MTTAITRTSEPTTAPQPTTANETERAAARGLLAFVKLRNPGRANRVVKLYQWAIGEVAIDGTIGPQTRTRALKLGALIPAPSTRSRPSIVDVPTANPERL